MCCCFRRLHEPLLLLLLLLAPPLQLLKVEEITLCKEVNPDHATVNDSHTWGIWSRAKIILTSIFRGNDWKAIKPGITNRNRNTHTQWWVKWFWGNVRDWVSADVAGIIWGGSVSSEYSSSSQLSKSTSAIDKNGPDDDDGDDDEFGDNMMASVRFRSIMFTQSPALFRKSHLFLTHICAQTHTLRMNTFVQCWENYQNTTTTTHTR